MNLSDFPPEVQAAAVKAREIHFRDRETVDQTVARAIMADRAGRLDLAGLTLRQADCLRFVHEYQTRHGGVSPSYDEIAAGIGISSRGRVGLLIDQLEERGRIQRLPNRARAITIVANPN